MKMWKSGRGQKIALDKLDPHHLAAIINKVCRGGMYVHDKSMWNALVEEAHRRKLSIPALTMLEAAETMTKRRALIEQVAKAMV